jgi:hypothetical protein
VPGGRWRYRHRRMASRRQRGRYRFQGGRVGAGHQADKAERPLRAGPNGVDPGTGRLGVGVCWPPVPAKEQAADHVSAIFSDGLATYRSWRPSFSAGLRRMSSGQCELERAFVGCPRCLGRLSRSPRLVAATGLGFQTDEATAEGVQPPTIACDVKPPFTLPPYGPHLSTQGARLTDASLGRNLCEAYTPPPGTPTGPKGGKSATERQP